MDVVLSYCHHTLFDRTLEGLLPYLQGKGVGVINASVLSMGLLTHEARTRCQQPGWGNVPIIADAWESPTGVGSVSPCDE